VQELAQRLIANLCCVDLQQQLCSGKGKAERRMVWQAERVCCSQREVAWNSTGCCVQRDEQAGMWRNSPSGSSPTSAALTCM
jgi:hypothetical protein